MASDKLQQLKKLEEVVAACNRCGFCTSYCPTYNATGSEALSPRGRNQIVRALMEEKIVNPALAKESVDTCLLCGECTSVCFSEVPTARLMVETRNYLNQTMQVPKSLDFFLKKILPYPKRFKALLKISFVLKNFGGSLLLRSFSVVQKMFPTLAAADALLVKAPMSFLLEKKMTKAYQEGVRKELSHAKVLAQEKSKKTVGSMPTKTTYAYMPVCGSQYLRPRIGLATIRLFEKLRIDFEIPDAVCCGLPAASYGVNDEVRALGRKNIAHLEAQDYEQIIVDDSSCGAHLKDLPLFFQSDADWIARAHGLSQKVRELSVFLLQRGLKEHLKLAPWVGGSVAYHDPCKAQYGQKIVNPPRELLTAIPRLKLVPIADSDQCCGGAGTYSFVHPELSKQVLKAKVKNIVASGCEILVTSSASCLTQVAAGLRDAGSKIQVLHLSEFLYRALDKRR